MNIFFLSYKNILSRPLSSLLSWLLLSFGVCVVVLLLLLSDRFKGEVTRNSAGVDLVIGAKGSPLQIILSSIFHIDFPTGNIEISDIMPFTKNRYIERTIPLSLGDSYNGYRIVGTIQKYGELYDAQLDQGSWFDAPLEAVIGSQVASEMGLKIGDRFSSQHGLDEEGEDHGDHGFKIVGILKSTGLVIDRLILVDMQSIWMVHDHEEEAEADSLVAIPDWGSELSAKQIEENQITSLLIKFRSPMGAVMLPNQVNQTSNLQAASPAFEASRLFSILENVTKVLNFLGLIIIAISGVSVFISLLNSLKDRKYEIAILRSIGASRKLVLSGILFEGLMITGFGVITGFLLGHGIILILFKQLLGRSTGFMSFAPGEGLLFLACIAIGIFASVIPAVMAYRTDISKTLAQG
ncbi:MAG: FtsX-like permease family protein [Cyclobacteriaceae bacterium]